MDVVQATAAALGVGWLENSGPALVWAIVLSFVFLECAVIIGLFLPGDSLLFVAGVVLASHQAQASAWWLSVAALLVATIGNQVGYLIGDKSGTAYIARSGGKILSEDRLNRARHFLDRKGFFAIVAARWIPWVRTFAPLIAGAAGMNPRRFALATFTGAVLWVPTLVLSGYYAADLVKSIPWAQTIAAWMGVTFLIGGTIYGIWQYRQETRKPVVEEREPLPNAWS